MAKSKDLPENKVRGGSPLSKQAIYSKIASRADYVVEKLFEECESRNPSVRIAALRTLINKVCPDLKSEEIDLKGKIEGNVIAIFKAKPTQ